MQIETVLFDADGVLQRPFALRREAWQRVLGPQQDVDRFVGAVFAAEELALTGHADFVSAFSGILAEWECEGALQDALAAWAMIEPDDAITDVVGALRRGGMRCCLATNQEPFRARHMSETLGYARLFDKEFYSCNGCGEADSGVLQHDCVCA